MGRPPWPGCQDQEKENNADPDDGNSWLCSACTLPIFSTPFKSTTTTDGGNKLILHDQCANLPKEVIGHDLHRGRPLTMKISVHPSLRCYNCDRKCGRMIYQCLHCFYKLDVLCALQIIKILHRSHQHKLMAISSALASSTCDACGIQHRSQHESGLLYLCQLCNFWIHPDCASLPNAIILHARHEHSLLLTYNRAGSNQAYTCAICESNAQGIGVYFCGQCGYYAHINCAIMSDPHNYQPVLIRDAKLAGLLHFPMADEFKSVMRYIMENTTSSSNHEIDDRDKHQCQSEWNLFRESIHQHTLTFHDQGGGDHLGQSLRVCNACVQPISPPFYSCSECPNFYLHDCCVNLPSKIEHPAHRQHTLFLFPKAPKSSVSGFYVCNVCRCWNNRFSYSCNTCGFTMDVVCALLPPSITHESHGKTHILYMSLENESHDRCNGCSLNLRGVFYECRICRRFKLDAKCVLLPNTIKHKFDEHLLKLTTKPEKSVTTAADDDDCTISSKKVQQICEICEGDFKLGSWHYSCSQCDQLFHRYCIPFVNYLSGIKLGVTIHVNCHDCPLTLVLESSVCGYKCSYCQKSFISYSDWLAYECFKCYFRIHEDCAKNVC